MEEATWEEKMKQWDEEMEKKLAELKPILPTPDEIQKMDRNQFFSWMVRNYRELSTREAIRHPLEELQAHIIHVLENDRFTEREKESCMLQAMVTFQNRGIRKVNDGNQG